MESLAIKKMDAAKRQLETAILLHFDHGDPVSVHTLACAAYDIIDGVNQHRGSKEMWVKRRYTQLPGRPTRGDINEVQNFLKHANRDPEGTLDFFPLMTGPMLADASRTYIESTGDHSLHPRLSHTPYLFTSRPTRSLRSCYGGSTAMAARSTLTGPAINTRFATTCLPYSPKVIVAVSWPAVPVHDGEEDKGGRRRGPSSFVAGK